MGMNLQTFRAPTMGEALTQVKSVMGPDAIILHTRTLQTRQWLGLRRREIVEITAGKGLNIGARNLRRRQSDARPSVAVTTYARAARPSEILPRSAAEGGKLLLETPAANSAALLSISQEMSA